MQTMPYNVGKQINKLEKSHPKGFDLSLNRIKKLLKKIGNPHTKLPPVIHVAGTNAKGSTITFVQRILEENGLRVHVHTSPHLVKWNERYVIGGKQASDKKLYNAIDEISKANKGEHITVFEMLSAAMFKIFAENKADASVVEVGLGGRLDATNIIKSPTVCVITPIGLDHKEWLGNNIKQIAKQKAGIIKPDSVVICSNQQKDAKNVIKEKARKEKAESYFLGDGFKCQRHGNNMLFEWKSKGFSVTTPLPSMNGQHQINNAATAIATTLMFAEKIGVKLRKSAIKKGVKNAQWTGRLQKITKGRFKEITKKSEIWIDGGHNNHAAIQISKFFGDMKDDKEFWMIVGMLNNRDPIEFIKPFKKLKPKIIAAPIKSSDNGFKPDELAEIIKSQGLETLTAKSLKNAFRLLNKKGQTRVLVTGSLYLIGDFLKEN